MRNWILNNQNQGNVLKMGAMELPEGAQTVTPEANVTDMRVLDINASFTLTIDGSKSLPGDEINLGLFATAASTITLAGDAAAGSIAIGAGGVGAVKLINMGTESAPNFISYVPLT